MIYLSHEPGDGGGGGGGGGYFWNKWPPVEGSTVNLWWPCLVSAMSLINPYQDEQRPILKDNIYTF